MANSMTETASNILSNLKYAETHIGSNIEADGKNTINMYVVKALISRFALFEGQAAEC